MSQHANQSSVPATTDSKESGISRRKFMKTAAAATAGAAIAKNIFPSRVYGANERIRTGHIGTGGMGMRNLQFCVFREQGDIQPIAVCDLLEAHRERAADLVTNKYDRPTTHTYHEEIIDNKDIDAVVIVTPDHWHTIPTIMACEAGKDVWCEKPLTTSIAEGQPIIDAVRANETVLQCGNFQRSGVHFQEVRDLIKDGYIGKVARVETWIHDGMEQAGIGSPPDTEPPAGLDWNRYLGWTQRVPFNENRFLYNFRWFLNYSGGKMTDWGAHLIDIVLWAMGEDQDPKTVTAVGGQYVLTDNRTTPDTLEVLYEFPNYILSFSNRVYNGYVPRNRYGIMFYGDKGTLYTDRLGYFIEPVNDGCEPKKVEDQREGDMNVAHWDNFVACVKSRKDPISYVESAFNTAKICHMGTTAYVAGNKQLGWDADKQRFTGDDTDAVKKANKWAYRPYQNGYSLEKPWLPKA